MCIQIEKCARCVRFLSGKVHLITCLAIIHTTNLDCAMEFSLVLIINCRFLCVGEKGFCDSDFFSCPFYISSIVLELLLVLLNLCILM